MMPTVGRRFLALWTLDSRLSTLDSREHWKDINIQSRELANLFDEIDEAADANKKPETEAAFAKMIKLIDGLNAHAKHDEKHEHKEEK